MSDPEDIDPSILTKFHLDPVLARTLERYYILKWSTHYLVDTLLDNIDLVLHQGIHYTPIFLPNRTILGTSDDVLLSFRYVEHGDPYGYVLIKPYNSQALRRIL